MAVSSGVRDQTYLLRVADVWIRLKPIKWKTSEGRAFWGTVLCTYIDDQKVLIISLIWLNDFWFWTFWKLQTYLHTKIKIKGWCFQFFGLGRTNNKINFTQCYLVSCMNAWLWVRKEAFYTLFWIDCLAWSHSFMHYEVLHIRFIFIWNTYWLKETRNGV